MQVFGDTGIRGYGDARMRGYEDTGMRDNGVTA